MCIVTWNVGNRKHGRAQWEYVTGLKPDIVLLQECRPPSHYLDQVQLQQRAPYFLWESIDGMGRLKGVCVYTNGFPIQQRSLNKFRGRLLATTVTPRPDMQVVVISVHVDTTGKVFKTAKEAARRIFDELSSLLQCSPYVILAGDLNLTVPWSAEDVPVRDRLVTEFGLVNCTSFLKDKARLRRNEVSTLRGYPHQDDYMFASRTFEINHFDVLQDTELSDHCPVVADLSERLAG
jgi:endonuclease/exonuclease/phosphatase family metal-dependent hydrolase